MVKKIVLLLAVLAALLAGGTALAASYPESAHPYASQTDQTWTYTHATSLSYMKVTFSADTAFESGWDFLYITDAQGNETRYTGASLAGRTLYFKGNKVTLRLTSDDSNNYYGFKIASIGAATAAEYNTPRYTISRDGVITGFSGVASSLTIPATVDGQAVTAIGPDVFRDNTTLTSVTLPSSVTRIDVNAFYGCTALKTVNFPAKLSSIGSSAFRDCTALTSVTLPNTVVSVDSYAFYGCSALKTVKLSTALTTLGGSAFDGCTALTAIAIPDGVTTVYSYTFNNCASLKTVSLPAKLNTIEMSAFYECVALTSVAIPACVTTVGYSAFYGCAALKTATFASGGKLTAINGNAFASCTSLTSVALPASLTKLDYNVFKGCSALKTVTFASGSRLTEIGSSAFSDCVALTDIALPDTVTTLGGYAFYGCTALKTATLSGKLTEIGQSTFRNCEALTSMSIPAPVKTIGDSAFSGCAALKKAAFNGWVTAIGVRAFEGCKALTGMALPDSVTSLGDSAFDGCSALRTVTLSGGLTAISPSAFTGCAALTEVTIPASVASIGNNAFYGCSALKSVNFASNGKLTEIGGYAFGWCASLPSVTLPGSLKTLGGHAFYDCSALTSATVPAGVKELADSTFGWCSALTKLTFKGSTIALGDYALYSCDKLASIDAQIVSMGKSALYLSREADIRSIDFADSVPALESSVIDGLLQPMRLVVTVGRNSPILPQLKAAGVCYRVRETGETNAGDLPLTTLRGKVEYIVRTCVTSDMSDYEKALALHDWLVDNAEYDESLSEYSPEGVLLRGTGVCQSYATGYGVLLDYVGIENSYENGDNHIWNMIKLDGEWYHIDVTWDDPIGGSRIYHNYFCLSNYAIEVMYNHECYRKVHIATGYKYNYAYRNGQLDELISSLRETISDGLNAGKGTVEYDSYDGFSIRTAILALRDGSYTAGGRAAKLNIDYDKDNYKVVAKLVMNATNHKLPASLTTIGAEAFAGSPASAVVVPGKVKVIGSKAFASCPRLWQIEIPSSVTSIAGDAFAGVKGLVVFGKAGSAAQSFAEKYGYGFVAE